MATPHEIILYAEPIGQIGNFVVTNSLLTSWLAAGILLIFTVVLRLGLKTIPGRFQSGIEIIFEGALGLADSVTGSRQKSLIFLPLVLPLFLFILLNNWLGILPGIGSIGISTVGHIVPLFRGGNADLNTTLALSLIAVVITHLAGFVLAGTRSHINRFISLDLLLAIPREVGHGNYQAVLVNPIRFLVGLIEVVGELAKVASLSFRLFGNVFAGEVLLAAMAAIFTYALPIPFIFLEVFVGLIQAIIFAMLVLVFLAVMSDSHEEAH